MDKTAPVWIAGPVMAAVLMLAFVVLTKVGEVLG